MSDDIKPEVKHVIDRGACVEGWTREYGEKVGMKRKKELEKFWNKIGSPNTKIRKPKKYKTVTDFVFRLNDVLTFEKIMSMGMDEMLKQGGIEEVMRKDW